MCDTKPYTVLVFMCISCHFVFVTSEQLNYWKLIQKTHLIQNKDYQENTINVLENLFDPCTNETNLGHVISNWARFLRHSFELVEKYKSIDGLPVKDDELHSIPIGHYNISDKCFFDTLAVLPGLNDKDDWAKRSKLFGF